MTRAVIKPSSDISKEMALIAKAIPTCAYSPAIPVAAFRYHNWRVILDKDEITIKDIEKEADAVEVINHLKDIIAGSGENNGNNRRRPKSRASSVKIDE